MGKYSGRSKPHTMARSMHAREEASHDWEAQHNSHDHPALNFDPDSHDDYNLTRRQYVDAYYRAFVAGRDTYAVTRGTSDAVWYWLVDVIENLTPEEYDERYGNVYG